MLSYLQWSLGTFMKKMIVKNSLKHESGGVELDDDSTPFKFLEGAPQVKSGGSLSSLRRMGMQKL